MYCIPRATLPGDDQQRMQYRQMPPSRNVLQSSMSRPGVIPPMGVDRGAYMLPNGNGMGMMGGRAMATCRPGLWGINSPGMPIVSTGNMLASGAIGMPKPTNIHSVAVPSPGNPMLRLHDALPDVHVSFSSVGCLVPFVST